MNSNNILFVGLAFITFFIMMFMFIWEPTGYNKFVESGRIDFTCKIYHEKGLTDKPVRAYIDNEGENYKLVFNNMNDKHLLELVLNSKERVVFINEWHKWEFVFDTHGTLCEVVQTIFEQPEYNIKRMEIYFPQ
jgi:hypothetical protein